MSEVASTRRQFEERTGVYQHARFGSVISAMITPFDADGNVNYAMAQDLAQHLETHCSEGLVLTGTTGESPTLTLDEEYRLYQSVGEAVSIPVLAGTGSNSTTEARERTAYVTQNHLADGVLVVSPYYNRPSQSGIYAHFKAVAESTDLPVVIYDIPVRTGRKMASDTIIRLAHDVPNIVALKDAAGDVAETMRIMAETPEDFEVYSGDDALNLPLFTMGAVGAISVASHWVGTEMGMMFDAARCGDLQRARTINDILRSSYDFETSEATPNPIPTRAMMTTLGFDVGPGRAPMNDPLTEELQRAANEIREQTRQDMKIQGYDIS